MRTYPFISNYLQSSGWELAKAFQGNTTSLRALTIANTHRCRHPGWSHFGYGCLHES